MRLLAKVTTEHFGESRIAFGGKHRDGVTGGPKQQTSEPHAKPQPEGRRDRSVHDGKRARCAREQDRLGQRAMQRNFETLDHEISAPPPNEKNDRKKLDAAKAIESPSTI